MIPYTPSLNCRGQLLALDVPRLMGILNLTPDSFSDGGKYNNTDAALRHVEQMLAEGADIIDIGAYSSRPGATHITPEEELARLRGPVSAIRDRFPEVILSIDTFRAAVAHPMLQMGVQIVNDIAGGLQDPTLMALAAQHQAPYVLMHMQGTPQSMQHNPQYAAVEQEVHAYFVEGLRRARAAGLGDVMLDPGFGFGKTAEHNYRLFAHLSTFGLLGAPLLIGISRKSMLTRALGIEPAGSLPVASALHYRALCAGVRILRVHDVAAAAAVRTLYQQYGAI
ncbi:MAG: dihydropteroate synthase [Sphingobacteriia bacterium]|jgi:dihydropteroate synthase